MNLGRRLAEGVGAWLQYQAHCDNAGMFSERFLAEPIGSILSAWTRERVIAEYRHPILQQHSFGSGRRPEIDFVVCHNYPQIAVAVESKWLGSTRPQIKAIMWDLMRLELLAKDGAECYFMLGGERGALEDYFSRKDFSGPVGGRFSPILRTDSNQLYVLDVTPNARHRVTMVKSLVERYQDEKFPSKILTTRTNPFPANCLKNQCQIFVWRIRSTEKRRFFVPKNSFYYVNSPANEARDSTE